MFTWITLMKIFLWKTLKNPARRFSEISADFLIFFWGFFSYLPKTYAILLTHSEKIRSPFWKSPIFSYNASSGDSQKTWIIRWNLLIVLFILIANFSRKNLWFFLQTFKCLSELFIINLSFPKNCKNIKVK